MIVSIGDIGVDHYITSGEKYIGGIATNFAVHVHRLHQPVTLLSVIGNDDNGALALRILQKEGLATDFIKQIPGSTPEQKIELVNDERNFVGYTMGVLASLALDADGEKLLQSADAVVIPLSDGMKPIFDQVMNLPLPSTKKIVDFSRDADIPGFEHGDVISMMKTYIDQFDIAFLGGENAIEDQVRAIAKTHPTKLIILTCGSHGSTAFFDGKEIHQPAIFVPCLVDTTGCGDAFRAGFVANYMVHHDVQKALEAGTKIGAATAEHMGAF